MPSASAARFELGGAGIVHRRHDDQDAIGAIGARFRHLIGLVHKVFAQYRQRTGRARLAQMIERAGKGRRVGQHRKARRAAGRIGCR